MKKVLQALFSLALLGMSGAASAQVEIVPVQDSISQDTHWTGDKQYLIKGYVYVTNGHTLTIDAGVIVKGDKNTKGALIVERGAKIYANGTVEHPVVFTSNQPAGQRTYGDWGGLIICGKAPTNWSTGQGQVEGGPRSFYGGTDPHDNSGTLTYVRIEFAGIAFSPNNEVNGLTLCAVGNQTQLDHIQVSYSGDDAFEWFGGNVNAKYIIGFRTWDDDFDNDVGFRGNVQYGVSLRDPFSADQSGSKAVESDSYLAGTVTGLTSDTFTTHPVFANMTLIGPITPTTLNWDPLFTAGVHIRRGSSFSLVNSIVAGWPVGILIDESSSSFGSTTNNITAGNLVISGVAIAGIPNSGTDNKKELFYVKDGARNATPTTTWADTTTDNPFDPYVGPYTWFNDGSLKNKIYSSTSNGLRLQNPFNLDNPSFVPTSTSPIVYNNKNLPAYVNDHFGGADHFGNGKKYPYDGTKAINTDTTNFFANYNAPDLVPNLGTSKLNNPFFDVANHIGAFGYTAKTEDDWTRGWANWDPVNSDYTKTNSVLTPEAKIYFSVYPNPASSAVKFTYSTENSSKVRIELVDITGRIVKTIEQTRSTSGLNQVSADVTDVPAGIYIAKLVTDSGIKTTKINVVK